MLPAPARTVRRAPRIGTRRRQLLASRVRRNDHGLVVGLGKPDGAVGRVASQGWGGEQQNRGKHGCG